MRGGSPGHLLMSKTAQNTVRIYLRKQSIFCWCQRHLRTRWEYNWGNSRCSVQETYIRDYVTSFPFPRGGEYKVAFVNFSVLPVLLFVVLLSFRFATCLRWRLDDATLIVVSTAFIIRNDGWVLRRVASIINHHVNQGEQGGHGEGGEAGEVGGVQGESLAHQVAGLCSQVSAL